MATPTTQREFVIPLENKPGTLAEVATALGKANINIQGYLLEAQGDFGVYRFIPSDPSKTEGWLKQSNRPYRTNEVITVPVMDKPGELGRLCTNLSKSGVNVTASYPTNTPNGIGIAFCVNDVQSARKSLSG